MFMNNIPAICKQVHLYIKAQNQVSKYSGSNPNTWSYSAVIEFAIPNLLLQETLWESKYLTWDTNCFTSGHV